MRFSASQLAAYQRCPLQYFYDRSGEYPRLESSATAYGTVLHHCVHHIERSRANSRPPEEYLREAIATWNHYWLPENIAEINGQPIDFYLPRSTWAGLRARGEMVLREYVDLVKNDDSQVLALEHPFEVQVEGTEHTISGFVDRLSIRLYKRKPYISLDDWKTGKVQYNLRHNVQGHVYAYASTRPEFWEPFDNGQEIYEKTKDWPRRFRWISLKDNKHHDGGWRVEQDYRRLAMQVQAVAASKEAGIYVPTLSGESCTYCPYKDSCGGIGLPADDAGEPQTY